MKKVDAHLAEIDGLRALAVLAVLLFHAFPTICTGGYIGVDIFFVISGFVISRTYLLSLIDRKLSLRYFYIRRVRRLAPAYTLVLGFSLLIAFFLLDPKLLNNYAKSLVSQPFYAQNFVFWYQGDYFEAATTKPLLHTWSLAIEEQFYLLFGLMILFLRRKSKMLVPLLFSMFAISLFMGFMISDSSPKTSFFLIPTRVWQFCVGIFAYLVTLKIASRKGSLRSNVVYLISVIALIYSIFGFTEANSFPGVQAIIASMATFLLLILFDIRPSNGYRAFNHKSVRYIGELSYSLYLWHWPIIVYLILALGRELFWYEAVVALALSFILSGLTYRYVENPIRYKQRLSTSPQLLLSLAISTVIFLTIGVGLIYTQGGLFRYSEPERTLLQAAQDKSPYRCGKLFRITNPTKEVCRTNSAQGDGGVLIIGDSHADQFDEMLSEIGEQNNIPVYLTVRNCKFNELSVTSHCRDSVTDEIIEEVGDLGIDTVIAVALWGKSGLSYQSFFDSVQKFTTAGVSVYLSEVVPHGDFFNPAKRAHALLHDGVAVSPAYTVSNYRDDVALQRSIFKKLKEEFNDQVLILKTSYYLCDSTTCNFYTNGYPNYFDNHHLTRVGVNNLKPMYEPIFRALLMKNSQIGQ